MNGWSPDISKLNAAQLPFGGKLRAVAKSGDFEAMQQILIKGRASSQPAYYPHLGNLCWWTDYRERPLTDPIGSPALPPGYSYAGVEQNEAKNRAQVSHAAFDSSKSLREYTENYRRFMRSPVYDSEKDMVVLSPEGRFVSFCLYWLDTSNRPGYIEPLAFASSRTTRRRSLFMRPKDFEVPTAFLPLRNAFPSSVDDPSPFF
ncbi:MAG TPA: hypothetical protein PKW59_12900 [Thermotogota bacterium]|nr:hypothetical protein [Thermotogota bacterium]